MTRHLILLCLLYIAFVGQAVLAPRMIHPGPGPHLLAATAVAAVFLIDHWSGLAWAAACGAAADVLTAGPLGVAMLVFTVVGVYVQRRLRERPLNSLSGRVSVVFLSVLAMLIASEALRSHLQGQLVSPAVWLQRVTAAAASTSFVWLALAWLAQAVATPFRRLSGGSDWSAGD